MGVVDQQPTSLSEGADGAVRPLPGASAASAADGQARPAVPRAGLSRLQSLDAVRGLMLIASVSVNSLWAPPGWFDHAPWDGVHPIDVVFPVFVTITGCGLAFAMHRRINIRPLARRVLVLLLIGLLYNAVTLNSWDLATWRFSGVLQLYAVIVAAMTLGHLVTRSWQGWALLTAVSAGAHTLLLASWARGCPGGVLTPECNPSGAWDAALLTPAHMYAGGLLGHDPEGIVAISGALVSAAAGATAGHLLLHLRARTAAEPLRRAGAVAGVNLGALGAVLVGAALLLVQVPAWLGGTPLPVMKRLWSAPFALGLAAVVVVALLVAHLLLDRPALSRLRQGVSWPLIALGRNSLLVYFGSHALMAVLIRPPGPGQPGLAERLGNSLAIGGHPQVTWTVLVVLAWTGLACLLHSRRIYLRP